MTWLIVLLAVVVVLVVAAMVARQTKSGALERRFGPEYERLLAETGDRRRVEEELKRRVERHDALQLRDLPPEAAANYAEQLRQVQIGFVDSPEKTVEEAGALVQEVMRERGYPADEFDEGVEMLSVDHPQLATSYRLAIATERRSTDEITVDELREAFQRYRSLLNELLGQGEGGTK